MNRKKTFALIRALAAGVVAVILLACSGFAFVDLLGSPAEISDAVELTDGAYVQTDVAYIMDICGVERNSADEAVAYYVIAPVGNEFVIIRFDAADYDDIAALNSETLAYLQGTATSMTYHINVVGTAEEASVSLYQLLDQWFADNGEWMSSAGVIAAVDDYSSYLGTMMINADCVGSVSYTAAVVLSIIAAVLVVYAVVEVVCILAGAYNGTKKKDKKEQNA